MSNHILYREFTKRDARLHALKLTLNPQKTLCILLENAPYKRVLQQKRLNMFAKTLTCCNRPESSKKLILAVEFRKKNGNRTQ